MSKVVWDASEWERLAAHAAPLIAEGKDPLTAYREAQKTVFASEAWRVRRLDSLADLRQGRPILDHKLAAIRMARQPLVVYTPGPLVPESASDLPGWMEAQIEAEAEREAARLRKVYEQRVAERVRQKLGEQPIGSAESSPAAAAVVSAPAFPPPASAIERAERDERALRDQESAIRRKHNPEMPAANRDAKPRVVIVGLWPSVRAEVSQEFSDVLDLRFFDNNQQDLAVMRRHAKNAALTVAFEKVGHEISAVLRRESAKFETTNGGSKTLVDRLTRFAVEGK